ncbi:Armadillo-like helical [Penicillium argentinense]|uniref:Armadillo-like helical n=1 Tax=Penicillium argentinense TaxID=1131581 RepID=A0A9W9FG23_9EURO|nr:Armadillo-like helical [Penicillium argentinense]KAJ5099528.1 Armadillo-like helical [Penicillium argentinense]
MSRQGYADPAYEAHTLVTSLYDPANQRVPARINEIQKRLQQLQKGEDAWEIADSLLRERSAHHRFMGALTFTVKLNVSGGDIEEPMILQILERLVNHFVAIVNEGEQAMVIRKLASSLTTIFRHPKSPWTKAIWNLAASLANGGFVSEEQTQTVNFVDGVLPALNTQQALALSFFSVALAEDGLRLEVEPQDVKPILERCQANIEDGFLLVQYIIQQISHSQAALREGSPEVALAEEAMSSWKAWLGVYASRYTSSDESLRGHAISCGQDIIKMLRTPTLSENAASTLTIAFENRRWSFDDNSIEALSQILSDSIVTRHIVAVTQGEEGSESLAFIDLLVAYLSFMHLDLFTDPVKPQNIQILSIAQSIFKTPGYASIDDSATPRVLEYWNEIAECITDEVSSDSEKSEKLKGELLKGQLAEVVLGLFQKLLYPAPEDMEDWGDDERSEFHAFRYEACDYLLAAYPILGVELVSVFQESATTHLGNQDWRGFEAAMFCIAQLSEAVDENGHADQCLDAIFGSEAFTQLCTYSHANISLKARQTLVDTFGKYQSYFERHNSLLPGVLNILFQSLSYEPCAHAASRSILTLSKSCARVLTVELPVFLDQFDQFRTKPTATVSTMPKVLEGIAAIIQRLPADEEKAQTLERIFGFFVQEAKRAREEASSAYEAAREHGHLILGCIASIGKGLRTESDEVINLDAAEEQNPYPPSFWNAGPGSGVQQLIMEAMRLLIVDFPVDSGIIESACDILKAGYTESSGLFVFPPSLTVDFIKNFPLGISGTDVIMATASSFLASHASHSAHIRDEAISLIVHVAQLFASMLENPDLYDPETANAGIDFLARLLPKYYHILFSFSLSTPVPSSNGDTSVQRPPVFIILLNFTIHALSRPEPLTIRSGSNFWVTLMDLRGRTPEETADIERVLEQFIPPLCQTLIRQFAGRCSRSDLPSLTDALRRTIFNKMRQARPSLEAALETLDAQVIDANGNLVPVFSPQDKSRFLETLMVARGARSQTLELVRSFWLKCRNMSFDYTQ